MAEKLISVVFVQQGPLPSWQVLVEFVLRFYMYSEKSPP